MKPNSRIAILALSAGLFAATALVAKEKPQAVAAKPVAVAEAIAPAAPAEPAAKDLAPKPKAVVAEPVIEAGSIAKGEKIVKEFVIRNEGTVALEISEVRPACGCTVADFTKSIAPGASGKVTVTIDTQDFNGPIAKGVTVFTNDTATPQIELTVRAKIEPYVFVKPGYARYITVQGEPKEGTINQTLYAPDGSSFNVVKVESPWPFLVTSFREAKPDERSSDAKGKQWHVEMHLSNDAPVGALSDFVNVTTDHPKQKLVQIPVSGFVRPTIAVTPPSGDFGKVELKEPLKRSINVRNFATEPIKVTSVESSNPNVGVSLDPLQEGREYMVRVTVKPEIGKGPFATKVIIHTDSPKAPALEVPITGTVL
jgi:hypothetical protein